MGPLLKYLLLGLIILWLFYSPAVRGRLRRGTREGSRDTPRDTPDRPNGPGSPGEDQERQPDARSQRPAGRIVPCAHCGVHLPLTEALHDIGGRAYCCEAHRLAGPPA